jgi:quinol monooxygenase YgiN
MSTVDHLGPFTVVELGRYTVAPGEAANFARYFESFSPEAFQQLGALVYGHFLERDAPQRFTWLRAFRDMDSRAVFKASFYYGPLWKEHRAALNSRLLDWHDVLMLRPLSPEHAVPILPAVDPLAEPRGAQGIVLADIFAVAPGRVDEFARLASERLSHHVAGTRPAGLLATLDEPNNFPQHPVRTDGPFLVSLTMVENQAAAESFAAGLPELPDDAHACLRGESERITLLPAHRSRLRWRTQ